MAMVKNYDKSVKISHNPTWPYISDHHYIIIIVDGSRKTNVLLNLIKHQRPDIDKNYLYTKRLLWRRGVVVITSTQLHSIKPEHRFCAGSIFAHGVSEIHDGEDL